MKHKYFSKNTFSKLMVTILSCLCALMIIPEMESARAMELSYDEFDNVFVETVNEYIKENCSGTIELVANKEIIYDIDLNEFGYIYDFTLNENQGYATVIDTKGYPEVAEIYFNSVNPLNLNDFSRIYIANSLYAYSDGSSYYLADGDEIAQEGLDLLRDVAYCSSNANITTSSETIYYTAKVETDTLQMAKRHPSIDGIEYSNACVPIAGANIIQYWDRFNPNLLENYTPGVAVGKYYLYNKPNAIVIDMAVQLYNLMGQNPAGATISQFKFGMSAYCTSKGYSITYESCMNNGKFNYLQAKEKMNNGQPLMLFVDPFTVATITNNGNSDQIQYSKVAAAHSMAGFGYKDIQYTLTNGQIRVDNYIEVASGMIECGNGYYNINYDTIIDDAYGIYIY